ncbi:beta-glucosidase [Moniliophthora roreri]|nr:beta-glucosidase [Moniliophthora roreri]
MPWVNEVGAIMQCWYQGMEMGNAIADILSGDANPSGKLPVSFPRALKDTPCYSNFGHKHMVAYEEGIYVGYRFYDTKNVEPLFAFGHGLSYSSFRYYDLSLSGDVLEKDHTITVSFRIQNDGKSDGKESYQVYISPISPSFTDRAKQELKGFGKLDIRSGATLVGKVVLDGRSITRYDTTEGAWVADKGEYAVLVGSSSRDIRLSSRFSVSKTFKIAVK